MPNPPFLKTVCFPAISIAILFAASGCKSVDSSQNSALAHPQRLLRENPKAMDDALSQAFAAWEKWQADDRDPVARKAYADAVANTLKLMTAERPVDQWHSKWSSSSFNLSAPDLQQASAGGRDIRISQWQSIEPSPALIDPKLAANPAISLNGVGAPVVLYRPWSNNRRTAPDGVSSNGSFRPATALLEFSSAKPGQTREVKLRLYSTRDSQQAVIAGKNRPLAWDLHTPIERQLSRGPMAKIGNLGLFRPDASDQYSGLFRADGWDPNKIPVVFIHGLDSAPHIWEAAMDGILADPVLRKRYQLWFFVYSTGDPVPGSAARLRLALEEMKQSLDPQLKGAGMKNMVLVGHSMGGLLTQMQVTDSGDAHWNAYFQKPIDQLKVSADDRKLLASRLYYQHIPWVKRAVFVCTPHRGSELATLKIVSWATKLIHAPAQLNSLGTRLRLQEPDAFNPKLQGFGGLMSNGVATLEPGHPYFAAINSRPILVPFHSIIGDRGKNDGVKSSDGVVPYWSSTMKSAKSELFVPGPHSSTALPETVTEIERILYLHIGLKKQPARAN